jgi:hypothetical protein
MISRNLLAPALRALGLTIPPLPVLARADEVINRNGRPFGEDSDAPGSGPRTIFRCPRWSLRPAGAFASSGRR